MTANGQPQLLNVYVSPIPWGPPETTIRLSFLFKMQYQATDEGPIDVETRIISEQGKVVARTVGTLPPPPEPGVEASGLGGSDGLLTVDAPGEYEVLLLVNGQPLDDAPTWTLRFEKREP